MLTKLQMWGNSLGLRIPKAFAEEASVTPGSEVDLAFRDGRLIVTPVRSSACDLRQLLSKVTKSNVHGEIDFDGPVGREVW